MPELVQPGFESIVDLAIRSIRSDCAGYPQSQNLNSIERVGIEPNLKCHVITWPVASDSGTAYTIEMRASP